MAYTIAAIDIHKRVLMVVVATAADQVKDPVGEALEFECRRFGALEADRRQLVDWLKERGVQEVVMESTAQYCCLPRLPGDVAKPGWVGHVFIRGGERIPLIP